MKKHLLFNQSFGTVGSPNQTDETQTRENRVGLMSYLHRTLMLLFAVLVMSVANIGMAWGEDITIVPDLSQAYAVDGIDYYCGLFSINHTGANMSSSAITATSNGGTYTVTFATTKSDMYIKSVTFNSVSKGTLSSSDGTIESNVFTTTGSKNSVTITMTSSSGQKGSAKITNVVVNTGSNEVETITFTGGGSTTTATYTAKKNGSSVTSAISSITSNANFGYSSSVLSIGSSKTMTFTSSSNIVFVAMHTDAKGKLIKSGSDGSGTNTYWSGSASSVTFKNTDSGSRSIYKAYVITEAAGSGWGIASSANSYTPASDEMSGSGTVTKTLSLSAGTDLQFKIVDISGNVWYGNGEVWGGTKTQSVSSTGTANNCHLLTTEAGSYTFSFNTSTKDLTITYPNSYTFYYANTNNWSKVYVYKFTSNGSTGKNAEWPGVEIASPTYTCGETDYYETTSDGYAKLIFTNNSNQTGDMVVSSSDEGKYVGGTGNSWTAWPTYTISYAANSGSGSMSSQTGIACGTDKATTANSFTAPSGYQFAGWKANVAVTIDDETVSAGTVIADQATLQSISSNITLTAQWELIPTYDVTYHANLDGTSGSVSGLSDQDDGHIFNVANNGFSKSGYKFKWWNTAANGSGVDYYQGEPDTIKGADIDLYAQWESVASNEEYWVGDPFSWSSSKITVGNMIITPESTSDVDLNGTLTAGTTSTIVNKQSGLTRHAKVMALKNSDKYLQIHFSDGKPINKLYLGSTTNNTDNKKVVVVYSATSDFTTAGGAAHEFVTVGGTSNTVTLSGYNQATKAVTDVSPSLENTYYYARIYKKITSANTVFDNTANLGDGATMRIYSIKAKKGATCTAPSTVTVAPTNANGYRYTPGETISLTCTASGGSGGDYSYQWQKYYDSDWHDIADATSAVYSKSNCTTSDGGSYRCIVSTGEGCETISDGGDGYKIRVWTFNGNYNDEGFIANNITWTGANTGTVTLTLNANSTYKFKVYDNDEKYFGCNSGMTKDESNWTFYTHHDDASVSTGKVAGEYTFTIDITNVSDNNISVSVVYPKMRIYMDCGSTTWCNDDPVFFAHTYGIATNDVMMTAHSCEAGLFYADVPSYNSKVTFTRQKTGSTEIAWNGDNYLNKSEDNISIVSNNLFTCTGWDTSKDPDEGLFSGSTYSPTTYTVSAAASPAGYGTVSAASVASVACETSISASTNTLTVGATNVTATPASATAQYTYAFDSWSWSPAGATVTSDVTATANFTRTPKNYDLTWNLGGGTTTSAGTGIASGVSANTTTSQAFGTALSAPTVTKTGYNFSSWSPSVASTMPAANTTYTATWSSTTPTISAQPSDVSCNVGDERSISVTASISTGGTPTYQWQVSDNGSDWANVASSGTSASYTVPTASAGTKYYRCVVTNPNGSATTTSDAATVTVTAVASTTYYLVTSTAQLNSSDTYVIMDDGKNAMMGVYGTNAMTAITTGFTAAADKSTVTVTSSDVNTLTLQAESSAWNIVGKDDNKLTTNTKIGENLYGNTPKATEDSKDNFVFSFADGKVTIKRDAETDFHIYYSSGTGFNQSTSSTNIRLYTSNSTPVYTVTYNLNGGTGTVPTQRAEKSGTSITLASSTGLTKDGFTFDGWLCSVNSTKYAAGASYAMTAVNTTFTAQWVAVSGYTVTYNYNGATSGASPTSATGASVTLPNPTRTGYELDGWYTTAGEKVEDGGETYNPTADITLYARWQVACDGSGTDSSIDDVAATGYTTYQEKGGSNVVFTSAPSIGFKYKDADGNTINNSTTSVVRNNAYKCQISSDSGNKGSIKTNSTFSNVDSISFYFAASDKGGCKIAVWCSTDDFSTDSTQLLSATTYADNNSEFKLKTLAIPSGQKTSALRFKFRFTVTSSGKTSYIDSLKIYSSTASSGTCYHVYYHGNGAESGFVSDTTSYADGAKATVLSYNDSRYPLTKEGNDFQGWATSAGGSAAYSDGEKITIDGADVHLYAKWATASSALVTWTMNTNTSTWGASATSTTDGTNIGSIATARTAGSDGKSEGATAKVTMASGEATGTAAPSNSANFTFTIKSSTKQVEINKFDCKVFNVGSGNRTYKAQISDEAGNVYNSTNTVAVSAEATLTDASFVFGSGKILRGDVTVRVYAWKTSGSPTEFRMGPDVKFYGTVEDYECATPSAPTISGASEYAVGQTITLAASHDGENYDNLTTYTWYRGADWETASAASPVQAAATGEDGYTLTKTAEAADDDLFWCKVSNGTCEAHNATGYNVNVYAANSITWHLNDGEWGEVEHKDSYTRFDDDYTLPIPSKDGYVFAGWYEASDFSGVPAVILESGSIGDKAYWAKWGSEVTVSWTVTKVDSKLYRGGGGYSVTAVINQADWDDYGDKDDLVLTATEGVTLKNVVKSINGDGKAQVFADFDITTGLAEDATSITFTLEVPAAGTYGPKVAEHEEDLTSCAGSSTVWDFTTNDFLNGGTWSTSAGATNRAYATDGTTVLTYYAGGGGDIWSEANEQLQTQGTTATSSGTGIKNLTQKYFVFPELSGTGKISVEYGTNNSALTIYEATSTNIYGLSPIITLTEASATSSTYAFSSDKNYYMTMESAKVYFKRITFTASSGGVTPTLTWDDGDEDIATTGVSKRTSDNGFVYTADQDKNSLGVITYSSSNTAVATVNASTGEVHLEGAAGNATITATIAASGCYEENSISYTITVVDDCDDVAGTIETEDLGCDGIKMTITGHTAAAGVSYQWYKDDAIIVGATSENYTATTTGSYYVVVTNTGDRHCAKRSRNTVEVEANAAATATKIVDSWYVKNGRRTPDIELVQTTNAESFTVTNKGTSAVIWNSDSTETTGFGGCGFHLGENGIIYLNGTQDDHSAPSGLTGATDVTLTITAIGCGGNESKDIIIHCQAETDRPSIAFVVDGTKGGAWDAVTSGHASGTDLYDYLNYNESTNATGAFDLTERNVYKTTNEKEIREHYSQFDAILITDDPSTDTKDGGKPSKSYVNAFGTMIDVRPILTMEAYVSKWSNWSAKGIAGNPQSPNPRQYEIRLECKDHEIYKAGLPEPEDGTNVWEEVIGGETFRHVILVDSTKGIYNGVAYNVETAGDKKPALQGFTGEAAGSLLGLGRISEGTLQAAIERQEEPAARLLVMGINAKALHETSALTPEGKIILRNILTYLLKTNMEEVDDCSNYFTGGASGTDTDWSKPSNWSKGNLPSSEAKVRILAPCVISGSQPHVTQVAIVSSGVSGIRKTATGSADCNGKLTIEPDGALIVEGEVLAAKAPHFAHNDLMPTTVNDLIINTNGSGQAALIFDNEEAETKATVNLYSLGRKKDEVYQFQYFAVPMEYVDVNPAFAGSGIYTYVWHENGGWERRGYYTELYAFEGVGITTKFNEASHNYTMKGTLASTTEREITLTANDEGDNIIGNSWMAPINIASLKTALVDDDNVDEVVYIYCTGNDGVSVHSGSTEAAGQWLTIPIDASGWSGWKGLKVIPAMQAFLIHANAETTLTLNYKDHVRSNAVEQLNEKLRAPGRRTAHQNEFMGMRMRVTDSQTHTDLYLFEGEQFSEAYDNGWEAKFVSGDGRSAQFYAMNGDEKMAVLATDELEGTPVGFTPGKESNYTISFFGDENGYYLNDIKLRNSVRISEGETYTFTFEEGDAANRFYISRTAINAPEVATGMENLDAAAPRVQKIIYNDKLYIIRGGRLYDATGKVVK